MKMCRQIESPDNLDRYGRERKVQGAGNRTKEAGNGVCIKVKGGVSSRGCFESWYISSLKVDIVIFFFSLREKRKLSKYEREGEEVVTSTWPNRISSLFPLSPPHDSIPKPPSSFCPLAPILKTLSPLPHPKKSFGFKNVCRSDVISWIHLSKYKAVVEKIRLIRGFWIELYPEY